MAYISIEVLDHEYNAFQTNMKLVSIGSNDFVGFGKLMNEKYNFKSDNGIIKANYFMVFDDKGKIIIHYSSFYD